jgi:hypothetical protein
MPAVKRVTSDPMIARTNLLRRVRFRKPSEMSFLVGERSDPKTFKPSTTAFYPG